MSSKRMNERKELMDLFSDTAKMLTKLLQIGITHFHGQESGLIRISKETESELFALADRWKKKGLI